MGCEIKEHFYTAEKEGKATLELTKGAAYGRLESPGFIIAETYPAYPTDAQSIILPLLATAKGNSRLKGAEVYSHDLRAGAAMIIAGLSASGQTTVYDNGYIQRGYDGITEKLRGIGAEIWEIPC